MAGDGRGNPFGSAEQVAELHFLKIEVVLPQDVLGFESNHASLVFELLERVQELRLGDAPDDSFGIPFPMAEILDELMMQVDKISENHYLKT